MKRPKRPNTSNPLIRTLTIIVAALLVIGGVTFALLQSQQNSLTGNTIETTTTNLQISTDGTSFSNAHNGFDFNSLIPGGPAQPVAGYSMYLKNSGGSPLVLKLAATSVPTNPDGVDLSKVYIVLTTIGSGTSPQSFNLQSLVTQASTNGVTLTGNPLPNSTTQQYKLQVSMDIDAVHSSAASIGNLDLAFTGVAVPN
jgi:hypothetical protein